METAKNLGSLPVLASGPWPWLQPCVAFTLAAGFLPAGLWSTFMAITAAAGFLKTMAFLAMVQAEEALGKQWLPWSACIDQTTGQCSHAGTPKAEWILGQPHEACSSQI